MQLDRAKMKQTRWEKAMTLAALSEKTGLSESYLRRLENGERRGMPPTIRKIEEALEMEPLSLVVEETNA